MVSVLSGDHVLISNHLLEIPPQNNHRIKNYCINSDAVDDFLQQTYSWFVLHKTP